MASECRNPECFYATVCPLRSGSASIEEGLHGLAVAEPEAPALENFEIRPEDVGSIGVVRIYGKIEPWTLKLLERAEPLLDLSGLFILLDCPGGDSRTTRLIQLVILRLRRRMPVVAFGFTAMSGGFQVGLACDLFFADGASLLGCFGSCLHFCLDWLEPRFMTSRQSPKKCHVWPSTAPAQIEKAENVVVQQKILDELFEGNLAAVAMLRAIDPEPLRPYLDGRVIMSPKALRLGLLDSVIDEELAYGRLLDLISKRRK